MSKYTYKDNNKGAYQAGSWVAPVVFECEAENISDADQQYEAALGKNPAKTPNIACLIS